jgi:molybdopterin molybdotransferase
LARNNQQVIMPSMRLITVAQAEKIILQTTKKARITACPISATCGRILAENIKADRDQPSADRSSMDGIALSYNIWKEGCREFVIEGIQKAGIAAKELRKDNGCFEIMTGGLIPKGCDVVIPIELVKIFGRSVLVSSAATIKRFQFIRKQGAEYKKGTIRLSSGTKINATHIAVAASVGKSNIKIFAPKIAVIGTGDELVELNRTPKIHQSRRSNAYALEAIFVSNGFPDVTRFHLNDNLSQLRKEIQKILKNYDVLVLSGGVSMGKFDLIPQVLRELGVKILFHKVSQKPGKPLLFGVHSKGQAVFGLPGNPVSTLVCAVRYVVPYLKKTCGQAINAPSVTLTSNVKQHPELTLFLPVKSRDGGYVLVESKGSGDYGALTPSLGFVQIPPGKGSLKKGTGVSFYSW